MSAVGIENHVQHHSAFVSGGLVAVSDVFVRRDHLARAWDARGACTGADLYEYV